MPKRKQPKRQRLQRVSIRAQRHKEPDWDRFAWALLQHSRLLSQAKLEPKRRPGKSA